MDVEQSTFRLGDLLCFTLRIPATLDDGYPRLLAHMTHGYFNPFYLPETIGFIGKQLRERFAWLDGITLPTWFQPGDWASFWAWLDTQEIKYGAWHEVDSLTDRELQTLWNGTAVVFEDGDTPDEGGLG